MSKTGVVAVVGGGISGLVSAYVLVKAGVKVVIYEKEGYLGSRIHSKTHVTTDGTQLDLNFSVFDQGMSPYMIEIFESLGVDIDFLDMSISLSLDNGQGYEWGTRNGFQSLFAQKKNILNPYFWKTIREIIKFKDDVLCYLEKFEDNPEIERNETMGQFLQSHGIYSQLFISTYLVPICASIWSCSSEELMSFSAYSVLSFFRTNHLLLQFGSSEGSIVRWDSKNFEKRVTKELENRGCQIRTNYEVYSVSTIDDSCIVRGKDDTEETFDGCIIAADAPDVLKMLGNQATSDELRILGAFQFIYSDIFLHHDKNLMPKNPAAWSAWNFQKSIDNKVCVTYWLNILQNISKKGFPFLVTLNPPRKPENTLLKWSTGIPIPSVAASKASSQLKLIQGNRRIWFSGAFQGYGFHENRLKAGMHAANDLIRKSCTPRYNSKAIVATWPETGARLIVLRFFKRFIATGCLRLLEDGGSNFIFEGTTKKSSLKVSLRIHSPQFYWKVATRGDIGFANAYLDGDFSFFDTNEGLLTFFMIYIANIDISPSASMLTNDRGWWKPLLFTSILASANFLLKHELRKNTLPQARLNISSHYDQSNQVFSLILDETMTYSCPIFQKQGEELKIAQMRKLHTLIDKARIDEGHHILEIGFGWGSFAIEAAKRTGCKYTGITLSEKQLQYAELKVKEAGLQDQIKFLLCDYRQLPKSTHKYDRIISCEMIEHVGHEYLEEFFSCCESVLVEDGLFVLQFISIQDQMYDFGNSSAGFVKEYIFPGGCMPSLNRVISVMAAASTLSVVHVEDIGVHYYPMLKCWRENLLKNKSEILAAGFDEKFIRSWEYYIDYCMGAFKSTILKDYQVIFTRSTNAEAYGFKN